MRILFLSPRQCWPTQSGAKLREYYFLRGLAERHQVSYAHFTDPGSSPLSIQDLPFCQKVIAVPKPAAYGFSNLMQGLLSSQPLPVLNYTSAAMQQAVDGLFAADPVDILHLDGIQMAHYASKTAPNVKTTCNWHNIESEAMRRFSETVPSRPKSWYARMTAGKLERVENSALRSWSGHVVCSQREKDVLVRSGAASERIEVVENGVDVARFSTAGATSSHRSRKLLFVGLMNYFPNVEAVTWFAQTVWPTLLQKFPELSFWIVGSNPLPSVKALAALPSVHVLGTVPDVLPYYADALAAVVPLHSGGGTRLKILEAMAAGIPVVSTPLGAEGLEVKDGETILIADPANPESWTRHIGSLMDSESRWNTLTSAARKQVHARYDWPFLAGKLCKFYETLSQECL